MRYAMNDLPREELTKLLAEHGRALAEDHPRCESLLRERCSGQRKEVNVLVQTLESGVVADLLGSEGPASEEMLESLASRVHEDTGLPQNLTRWGVESWSLALSDLPAQEPAQAAPAFDIDPPACFYLGREYDLEKKTVLPDRHVMYDARDLTTHGVLVGMTGSPSPVPRSRPQEVRPVDLS
jgi:hypothetical protein